MPKITFRFLDVLPAGTLAAHLEANKMRPGLKPGPHPPLAVVGGHPNVADHIEDLRAWDGDVWAINGAWRWCEDRGIRASFVSIDPTDHVLRYIAGARHAILARHCDPRCFDAVVDAECADIGLDAVISGPTTASAIPHLAVMRGHKRVCFFGCGASFGTATHAYADQVPPTHRLRVQTASGVFETDSGLLVQTEWLAGFIRAAPHVFSERSGELLSALIADPDYDITAASRDIHEALTPV